MRTTKGKTDTNGKLIPAAGYIRMSTDRQEDSPARQRMEIEALAEREHCRIAAWYEDHGKTGTESKHRQNFQRLLADCPKKLFQAVLMHEQSRMSREDVFEAMMHWKLLRDAGVRVATSRRGMIDFNNLGDLLMTIIDQHGAHDESVKIADRSIGGRLVALEKGEHIGGTPFGYDREIYDGSGNLVRCVSFRERFQKPKGWRSRVVPSREREAVEAVRYCFTAFLAGATYDDLAKELNRRKIRTAKGSRWYGYGVKLLLKCPTYAGLLLPGRWSRGKFRRLDEDGVEERQAGHESLVSVEVFRRVQEIIAQRRRPHSPPGKFLLSGVLYCAICGTRMNGHTARTGSGKAEVYYVCHPRDRDAKPCRHPSVTARVLEDWVIDQIRQRVLSNTNRAAIQAAIARQRDASQDAISSEEAELAEIRRRIERATENLALADPENMPGIQRLIAKWRDAEMEVLRRLGERKTQIQPDPKAAEVIAKLGKLRAKLRDGDSAKLAMAIRQTVKRVEFGSEVFFVYEGHRHFRRFGRLEFHDSLGLEPVILTDAMLADHNRFYDIADYVKAVGRPIQGIEIAKHFGVIPPAITRQARMAMAAGLIRKAGGPKDGWIAAE